jgi:hypothetical protein
MNATEQEIWKIEKKIRGHLVRTESARGDSRTGLWGQTRHAYFPLDSFLWEDPSSPSITRSSTLLFLNCASLAQLSPPKTLISSCSFFCRYNSFFLRNPIFPWTQDWACCSSFGHNLPLCLFLSQALTVCYGAQVSKQEREKKRIWDNK